MLNDLEQRVHIARSNREEMDRLISEYLPFIKKQVQSFIYKSIDNQEYDDMLSIGMFAFVNSVRQFEPERGSFLSFASLNIRSRLIDEFRRNKQGFSNVVQLFADDTEETVKSAEESASIMQYSKERERETLSEEIGLLQADLSRVGIDFSELPKICPKQNRSRKQCIDLARAVVGNERLKEDFIRTWRLPQAALAEQFRISVKTIEKHRRYIVAIIVMLLGDYPCIRAFLPEEVR